MLFTNFNFGEDEDDLVAPKDDEDAEDAVKVDDEDEEEGASALTTDRPDSDTEDEV